MKTSLISLRKRLKIASTENAANDILDVFQMSTQPEDIIVRVAAENMALVKPRGVAEKVDT